MPSQPPPGVHARAGSFGGAAGAYERGRPSWPPAALDAVARRLELSPESAVLDLAAGTGKLTRLLVPRFASVTAVEPLDGMRAVLEEAAPGARVLAGTAEAIPLADAAVDAVLVAEAFHWFDPARAAAEIARVLRPSGGLAVVYNRLAPSDEAWRRELNELLESHRLRYDDVDYYDTSRWRPALTARFGTLVDETFENPQRVDVMALCASFSWIAGLPPERHAAALAALAGVFDRHGIREAELAYRTEVVTARRRGP